jgi:PAS domain S-box-containing protein
MRKDDLFSHINPSFTKLLGFREEEFVSRSFMEFVHLEDKEDTLAKIKEIRKGKTVSHFINKCLMVDGNFRSISWTAILPDSHGDIYMVGQDWTEIMNLQEQLMQERLTKERSVMQATLYGQEMEKNELGKELHDNINQLLGAAKLYLEMSLAEDAGREYIIRGRDIIGEAIEEIRGLTKSLVGPIVREISLVESVRDLIDTFLHKKDLHIRFRTSGISEDMPSKLKLMFFRIVQEQLNNIQKHARAHNISITIKEVKGVTRLRIRDDGIGFDPKTKKKGIGLSNIRSRIQIYSGRFEIKTAPGRGCLLTVTIPRFQKGGIV